MNEAYVSSQKTTVMQTIVEKFRKVSEQRYYVRRGPINWSDFNFDQHPFAVSVGCAETSFLRHNPQTLILSLEMMMKMRPENEIARDGLDDTGLDQLMADASTVIAEIETEMQAGMFPGDMDNIAAGLNHETDKVVEISDSIQGIQGLWIACMIDF